MILDFFVSFLGHWIFLVGYWIFSSPSRASFYFPSADRRRELLPGGPRPRGRPKRNQEQRFVTPSFQPGILPQRGADQRSINGLSLFGSPRLEYPTANKEYPISKVGVAIAPYSSRPRRRQRPAGVGRAFRCQERMYSMVKVAGNSSALGRPNHLGIVSLSKFMCSGWCQWVLVIVRMTSPSR